MPKVLTPEELDVVEDEAYEFAHQKHKGQFRKFTRVNYIDHPREVGEIVSELTNDPEIIAAAYLHDCSEDTDVTLSELESRFGSRIAMIVNDLTNVYTKEVFPHLNRAERKARECSRMRGMCEEAKLIKRVDISVNLKDFCLYKPRFAVTYLQEKAAQMDAISPKEDE